MWDAWEKLHAEIDHGMAGKKRKMLNRNTVRKVLSIYKKAWEGQDPELILSIFTEDAVYHERIFDKPYVGHDQIRDYWNSKVVSSQANIVFKLLNTYVDGDVAIAEWEAAFDDLTRNLRKTIREVAILEFRAERIFRLREYWQGIEEKR